MPFLISIIASKFNFSLDFFVDPKRFPELSQSLAGFKSTGVLFPV